MCLDGLSGNLPIEIKINKEKYKKRNNIFKLEKFEFVCFLLIKKYIKKINIKKIWKLVRYIYLDWKVKRNRNALYKFSIKKLIVYINWLLIEKLESLKL